MINTYINPKLVDELKQAFPNSLPSESDYFSNTQPKITPEQIAFLAGEQQVIRYLCDCMEMQKNSEDSGDVKILISK